MTALRPDPPRRPIGLVLPFAAIGFTGSALVADVMFGSGVDGSAQTLSRDLSSEPFRIGMAVVIAVTGMCALLGRALREPIAKSVLLSGFLLAAGAAVAGAASGASAALLAALLAPGFASQSVWALIPAGGYLGLMLAPVFWVPLAAVFFARRGTGDARAGSILAGSERRRVWAMTAFVIAVGSGWAVAAFPSAHPLRATLVAIAATGALGVFTAVEVVGLGGLLSLARSLERIAEPHEVLADAEVDVGVGDERWMSGVTRDAPYRGVGRAERSVRGAIFDVQGRLTRAVLVDAGLFCVALLLFLAAASHRPSPPVVAVASPPLPAPASTLPAAGVRWLSWYPLSPPILVDLDGDGHEDIVGLRWNAGQEARAMSVTATSGATLAPMWQSEPIACQWANPQVRLLRSGDRLFLSDSEKHVHVYDLHTGREVSEPVAMPGNARLQCADEAADAEARVWLWDYPKEAAGKGGYVLDAKGIEPAPTQPKWCEPRASHPPCSKVATAGTTGTCESYGDYRAPPIAPKFIERYSLREGDAAVAIGARRPGDVWSQTDTLVGYDPKTRKVRWDQPVAREREAHAFPRIQVELEGGKLFTFFQVKTGDWELSARDALTGKGVWSTEPPRAMEGTNFDSLTITAQGLYLGLSNRLEVFDPETGGSRGVVW